MEQIEYNSKMIDLSLTIPCCYCSVVKSCLTLCNPLDCRRQVSLSFITSWSLLTLMSFESVMPSRTMGNSISCFKLPTCGNLLKQQQETNNSSFSTSFIYFRHQHQSIFVELAFQYITDICNVLFIHNDKAIYSNVNGLNFLSCGTFK